MPIELIDKSVEVTRRVKFETQVLTASNRKITVDYVTEPGGSTLTLGAVYPNYDPSSLDPCCGSHDGPNLYVSVDVSLLDDLIETLNVVRRQIHKA